MATHTHFHLLSKYLLVISILVTLLVRNIIQANPAPSEYGRYDRCKFADGTTQDDTFCDKTCNTYADGGYHCDGAWSCCVCTNLPPNVRHHVQDASIKGKCSNVHSHDVFVNICEAEETPEILLPGYLQHFYVAGLKDK